MTVPPVWLNGRLVPGDRPVLMAGDRGFLLGDGVFETLRSRAGRILWLRDHLRRLRDGAAVLGIPVPMFDAEIEAGLDELLGAMAPGDYALRLTLSRGVGSKRGLWPAGDTVEPTIMATAAPLPPTRAGLRLIVATATRRNEHSPLSRIKSLNYGDNLLARQEAERGGADDAILLNTAGRVACTTVGSLFLKIGLNWVTPSLDQGILPGLARARLLAQLGAEERPLESQELDHADFAFTANSLGLNSIIEINARKLQTLDLETLAEPLFT